MTLPASLDSLERAQGFVLEECGRLGLDEAVCARANLILEEMFVNIASYAYPTGSPGLVAISCGRDEKGRFRLVLEDRGEPFDPSSRPAPDTAAGLDERGVGGLGILMVRRMSDEMRYERRGGLNVLDVRVASEP